MTSSLVGSAARLRANVVAGYENRLVSGVLLVASSFVVASLLAMSITRPLARVRRRAQEVVDGVLELDPLDCSGPRETAVVSAAMSSWSSQDRIKDTSDAAELAKRLIETVSEPIEVSGLSLTVGASVGVALALDGHEDPMQLLARADLAVNRAKQRGRGRVEQYDESLQRALLERADVEQALAVALRPDSDELVLHYQPLTRAETGTVLGVEALVRWNRPGHEQWRPDRFIPIAEASNLIIDLDRWVLSTAARQLAQWSAGGELESVYVAVNISGRHLVSGRRHPAGTGHSVAP